MRIFFLVFASLLTLFISSCSSIETTVISGTANAIEPYQRFFWADVNLSNDQSPALLPAEIITADSIIKSSIENTLQQKGYQLAKDQQSADMLIDYRILITEQVTPQENLTPSENIDYGLKWNFGDGQAPTFSGWKTPDDSLKFYQQGNLYIGFFDAKTDARLWIIHATEPLSDDTTEEEWIEKVNDVVQNILKPVTRKK